MSAKAPELSYCAAEVRRHDPERFLTALFAPRERREDLLTLYAFNLEVAKAREVASEPTLGLIRLEWWRETIAGIYAGEPRRHAVALPLAELVARRGLTRGHFERLIAGRERDFDEAPPASLAELESYAAATSSTLQALVLEALGVRDAGAEAAAREVGIAWALAGLLRAVPFHARWRRLYLPRDALAEAGLEPEELFARGGAAGLAAVVRPIAERAREHIAAARRQHVPRAALPALLPAVLAEWHIGQLRRSGFDPFALEPRPRRPFAAIRLTLAALRGRY